MNANSRKEIYHQNRYPNERFFFFFIERNVTFIFLPLFISSSIRDDDFHSRKVTFNLSSSSLLTNFPRFSTTVGNYRSRRFTLAAVSLTSIRVHGRQCFRNTRFPSNACEQSLGFVYIPIPILTAPPSRLVWSRPPYSSRPVTAQIRPIPSRPVPTVRPVPVPFVPTRRRLVSPRLASPRFVSLRHGSPVPPVRSCGHVDRSLPCNEIRSPSVSP